MPHYLCHTHIKYGENPFLILIFKTKISFYRQNYKNILRYNVYRNRISGWEIQLFVDKMQSIQLKIIENINKELHGKINITTTKTNTYVRKENTSLYIYINKLQYSRHVAYF